MSFLEIFVLSLVQGLTEFLPVSSSGHLILIPHLTGWADQGAAMDVAVHMGTLLSVLIYFRQEVGLMFKEFFFYVFSGFARDKFTHYTKLGLIIVVATLPAVIFGFALKKMGMDMVRHVWLVASTSIFFGLVLWVADQFKMTKSMDNLGFGGGFMIGLAQAMALIPGTSRSGICITAARFLGFDRVTAARFSFLLSIPSILGAGVLTAADAIKEGQDLLTTQMGLSLGLSFIFGLGAIHFMIQYLMRHGLGIFTLYRVILGIALLVFFL